MPDETRKHPPTLSEDLAHDAHCELGETSDVKEAALSQLRKLIAGEPQLDCPMDEDFLMKFLRGRKYDVDCAFRNVRKYFKARIEYPQMFQGLTPQSIRFDATCRKHRLLTASRKRDPEGRVAAMLNIGAWNADICPLNDVFRAGCVHLEYLLLQQEVQIKGFVFILNVQGLSVYHMAHYTPSVIKRLLSIIQDYLPLRIKGIYIIYNPALFDVLFAIAKPFMKAKLLKRIRLFGHNLRELRDLVPEDLISEEHGGTHESYDYGEMERDLQSHSDYFQRINSHGYRSARRNAA